MFVVCVYIPCTSYNWRHLIKARGIIDDGLVLEFVLDSFEDFEFPPSASPSTRSTPQPVLSRLILVTSRTEHGTPFEIVVLCWKDEKQSPSAIEPAMDGRVGAGGLVLII